MDTDNKRTKYCNPLQGNLFSEKKDEDKDKEDDRELLGVDDKLIGDDLDLDEALQNGRDKEAGSADEENRY